MKKIILIIGTGYFGDVLLTSKLTRDIKKHYPSLKLVYICDSPYASVAKNLPGVDDVIPYDRTINSNIFNYLKFIFKFPYKNEIFHTFIIHQNKKSRIRLAKALGSKEITTWESFMAHENYSKSLKRDPKYANVAYFNGNMLSVLTNAPTDDSDIEFSIPENSQEKVDAFLAKHEHQELISINPQAGDEEKCWDVEEFITFVKTLIAKGITPVITGVSKDGEDFIKAIETDEDIDEKDYLNLIDKTNFTELGALYKRCSHVVSVDTGAAHMSSAVGTSTLVLFFRDDAHLWAPINTEQNSFIYNSHITAEEVMSELFKKTTSQISAMPST